MKRNVNEKGVQRSRKTNKVLNNVEILLVSDTLDLTGQHYKTVTVVESCQLAAFDDFITLANQIYKNKITK